jgi:Domain of unknown function (DUF4381)
MIAPLDKLHDFYQPPPPSWRPQTPTWYALFAIIALLLLWFIIREIKKWIANRYRREALRGLAALPPERFSELLKRTALSAWPREKVAPLSGQPWLNFLDTSAPGDLFHHAPADRIEEIALRSEKLSTEDERSLRETIATWIRRHRVRS